jgi:hypothetical protein
VPPTDPDCGGSGKNVAIAKTGATLETLERKLEEAAEAYGEMDRLQHKLSRLKRGSDAYFRVMSQISVAATVLKAKCESLESITDEIVDALPDD